jgi:hydroxymethylbilane synthase
VVTPPRTLRIASRGSRLALWQTKHVAEAISLAHPEVSVSIEVVRTTGDRVLDVPLALIGDRGLFTKEIDDALLDGAADLAVHSLKDVPTRVPAGLRIAAVSLREDPRDVILMRDGLASTIDDLPPGSRIGTSSLRRRAQVSRLRPDLEVLDLRGNLDTRLQRLDSGAYEAIILAAAGLARLGMTHRITHPLPTEHWLPAVGQGALAIMGRVDDHSIDPLLEPLHDDSTATCVMAERSFLRTLEGGCQVPIGALATLTERDLRIDGFVAHIDGSVLIRDQASGPPESAESTGTRLANALIDRGAAAVLDDVRRLAADPSRAPTR